MADDRDENEKAKVLSEVNRLPIYNPMLKVFALVGLIFLVPQIGILIVMLVLNGLSEQTLFFAVLIAIFMSMTLVFTVGPYLIHRLFHLKIGLHDPINASDSWPARDAIDRQTDRVLSKINRVLWCGHIVLTIICVVILMIAWQANFWSKPGLLIFFTVLLPLFVTLPYLLAAVIEILYRLRKLW